MEKLRCALLDIDGTLLDSNAAHARAWSAAMRHHGVAVDEERVHGAIGMGGDLLLRQLADLDVEHGLGKRINQTRSQLFKAELPGLRPFPRVVELLERLRGRGLTCVVATSAAGDEVGALLERAGIAHLIDAATSSADAAVSKPAPDIVEAALARAGVAPDEALMLGDTPYDIEAATRARVGIVAVRSGGWPFTARDGALAVYDDAAALLADFENSPFGR